MPKSCSIDGALLRGHNKDKIRIVLEGLRGEHSIAELCQHEGIFSVVWRDKGRPNSKRHTGCAKDHWPVLFHLTALQVTESSRFSTQFWCNFVMKPVMAAMGSP